MDLCWITLRVKNMEKSLSFYEDIIKLELKVRVPVNEKLELAFLGNQSTKIELVWEEGVNDIQPSTGNSIGFRVASVDQLYLELLELNYPIEKAPFQATPNQKFMYIKDYDGNLIQFNDGKDVFK